MPEVLTDFVEFLGSDAFSTIKLISLAYFSLLWIAIIIWVTRDALARSNSILFQAFAILINIAVPILGVVLYLIIRPGRTRLERYYEDLEAGVLETESDQEQNACDKCLTPVDKAYIYCPNCAAHLKKACPKCKKSFPNLWNICPFCGKEYKEKEKATKKHGKKKT